MVNGDSEYLLLVREMQAKQQEQTTKKGVPTVQKGKPRMTNLVFKRLYLYGLDRPHSRGRLF